MPTRNFRLLLVFSAVLIGSWSTVGAIDSMISVNPRGGMPSKAYRTVTSCFGNCLGTHTPSSASSLSSSSPTRTNICIHEPTRNSASNNDKKTTQHVTGKGKAPVIASPARSSSSSSPDWTPHKQDVGGPSGVKGHESYAAVEHKKPILPGWSTIGYRP